MTTPITQDHELDVLSQIHANTGVKQRDIAHAIGLSLGMTNAILKRLAAKGFVSMRRINSRNIHYLLTPDGVELIAKRSYRYLRRTVGHVVRYKERLREVLHDAVCDKTREPVTQVVLAGESDLEFVVEWCAQKEGLGFAKAGAAAASPSVNGEQADGVPAEGSVFRIAAESLPMDCECDLHLAQLVLEAKRE